MYNEYIDSNAGGVSIGLGQPVDCINEEVRKTKMSLMHVHISKDGLLMVSESRSTKRDGDQFIYDDNFRKIYYSEKFKTGICSVGLNVFGPDKLGDLIANAENDPDINTPEAFMDRINSFVYYFANKYDITTTVCYGRARSCLAKVLLPEIVTFDFGKGKIDKAAASNCDSYVSAGIDWGRECLSNFAEQHTLMSIDDYTNKIVRLMKDLIAVDHKYNKTSFIGGNIQILKILQDGTVHIN